jgi:hypothetical protein
VQGAFVGLAAGLQAGQSQETGEGNGCDAHYYQPVSEFRRPESSVYQEGGALKLQARMQAQADVHVFSIVTKP